MEFEKVEEELDPFRYGDLPGIEYGPGQRGEPPMASEAHVPLDAVGPLAVLGEQRRSASRAAPNGDRVDERGFLGGGFPVLLVIPFEDGGLDEALVFPLVLAPRPGKLPERREKGLPLFVYHVLGGRLFRGSVPGPPSQSATVPGKGH